MFDQIRPASRFATSAAALCLSCSASLAHSIAGDRVFPATLAIDDPGVADELALPTLTYLPVNSGGFEEFDITFNYAKRVTENLAVSIGTGWTQMRSNGSGWQNLNTQVKYRLFVDDAHEMMASISLAEKWGQTGSPNIANPYTTLTPNFYLGKGFGDLPRSLDLLRPFAITTQIGVGIPTQGMTMGNLNPTVLNWGFTLQYSLPYLNSNIGEIGGPEFVRHLVPLVEAAFQSPVGNAPIGGNITTGTVQPGVMYMGSSYQVSLEAVIPVNSASGRGVGVMGELHFFLDDIFPNSLGRPIFR